MRFLTRPALLIVLAGSLTTALKADNYVRLLGTVKDSSGNPVVGAKVVLERKSMNWKVEMETDKNGGFSRIGILPSPLEPYQITISHDGFQTHTEQLKMEFQVEPYRKTFQLYRNGEASPDQAAAVNASKDPAVKADSQARSSFNKAIPLFNAQKFSEALPDLQSAYKDILEASSTLTDEAAKSEAESLIPTISMAYGVALYKTGKTDEAIDPLTRAVENDPKNPKNADGLKFLADIYAQKKDEANRLKYQKMLNELTGQSNAIEPYNSGVKAFNANKFKEAKQYLLKATQEDPSFPDSYYLLGLISLNQGDMAGAKAQFRKYVELAPNGKHAQEIKDMGM